MIIQNHPHRLIIQLRTKHPRLQASSNRIQQQYKHTRQYQSQVRSYSFVRQMRLVEFLCIHRPQIFISRQVTKRFLYPFIITGEVQTSCILNESEEYIGGRTTYSSVVAVISSMQLFFDVTGISCILNESEEYIGGRTIYSSVVASYLLQICSYFLCHKDSFKPPRGTQLHV